MITMKSVTLRARTTSWLAIFALVIAWFVGFASQVSALTLSSSEYMGIVISGEPSSPASEVTYINTLADQAINTTTSISGHTYKRSGNTLCYNTCPDAITAGSPGQVTGSNSVNLGTDGFLYLLAKYDGPNGGDVIWYIDGLTGIVTIPSDLTGTGLCTTSGLGSCGLSHYALYNPTTDHKVPEPTTLILLGSGLVVLAVGVRRKYNEG